MKRIINNTMQPQMLEDGTSLAASGTEGSERLVESISVRDEKRLARSGKVSVYETDAAQPAGVTEVSGEAMGKSNRGGQK
jgi:hypothetical protein